MEIIPTTADHEIPGGGVTLLGAVRSVTGACTRVVMGGACVLVDCGVAQGREARSWQFPEAARDADLVLLTHGHNDHVGSLPALIEGGFDRPIYATRATLEIAELVLKDGIRLSHGSKKDVAGFLKRFHQLAKPLKYDTPSTLRRFRGTAALREAGHILGSTSVELVSDDARVIVSGDLGRPDTPILRDYATSWDASRPVDLVVMESTYGDGEHRMSHDDVEAELGRIVRRALSDGGHILVPAFAIGRTQTLLYHLNSLVEANKIPRIPVAVDTPMGLAVTDIYDDSKKLFDREALDRIAHGDDPLDFDGLFAVHNWKDSERLRDVKQPMLIIAGSGMCTGGRIVGHLKELLPIKETCVVFVGFQAPGTPGRRIQEAAESGGTVRLDHEDVPVRAAIETLSGLSAHADRHELLRWLRCVPGARRAALHHGEVDAQRAFATWAMQQLAG